MFNTGNLLSGCACIHLSKQACAKTSHSMDVHLLPPVGRKQQVDRLSTHLHFAFEELHQQMACGSILSVGAGHHPDHSLQSRDNKSPSTNAYACYSADELLLLH